MISHVFSDFLTHLISVAINVILKSIARLMGCLVQCQAKLGDDQATVSPDAHDDRYEFTEMTNRRPGLMQRKPTTNPVGMLTRLVRQILPPASDRLRGFVQAVVGNGDRDRLGNLTVGPETLAIDDQAVSASACKNCHLLVCVRIILITKTCPNECRSAAKFNQLFLQRRFCHLAMADGTCMMMVLKIVVLIQRNSTPRQKHRTSEFSLGPKINLGPKCSNRR